MKQLLSVLIGLLLIGGCARYQEDQPRQLGEITSQGFVEQWRAPLTLDDGDELQRGYLVGETLYIYSGNNRVFALDPRGGQLRHSNRIASATSAVRRPTVQGDYIIYPTRASLEVYSRAGRHLKSVPMGHSIRSPGTGAGNIVYVGLDYPIGGRLAKIDIARAYGHTVWELMTDGGLSAAPVWYDDAIYVASEGGTVYAVNAVRAPIWSTPGNVFRTDGPVVADIKVDDTGVYVASTDTKLYCIDRLTGRIKWQYYAGRPLTTPPVLTSDRVYQFVRGQGLVALDKRTGEPSRQPLWALDDAREFLAEDEAHTYVAMRDGRIAAVDRTSGEIRFRSQRRDFDVFVANTRDGMIYAARRDGTVIGVRPVLSPGAVGYIVQSEPSDLILEPVAAAE
jgi:outer membrane protein assembly factor BamB